MNSGRDIEEERRAASVAACSAIEQFVLDNSSGVLNLLHLATAAYHAGLARGLYRTQDLVDTLEERLNKRKPKAAP